MGFSGGWGMVKGEKVVNVCGDAIEVTFKGGGGVALSPVPMERMPSASPRDWLLFQGAHVSGTEMSDETISRVQLYMRVHKTEALTDGRRVLTVAGNHLALCEPGAIH